jgi:hypothetical protein
MNLVENKLKMWKKNSILLVLFEKIVYNLDRLSNKCDFKIK